MVGVNTQESTSSHAQSPENTKPVFRKTHLPSGKSIRSSKDSSLTLLPFYRRDKNLTICDHINSLEREIVTTKLTTDNEKNSKLATEICNPCNDQHPDKGAAASSHK